MKRALASFIVFLPVGTTIQGSAELAGRALGLVFFREWKERIGTTNRIEPHLSTKFLPFVKPCYMLDLDTRIQLCRKMKNDSI